MKINMGKENPLISIGCWNSNKIDLNTQNFPINLTYKYCDFEKLNTTKLEISQQLIYDRLQDLRKAAECHRQVRRHIQEILKPGLSLITICDEIENKIVELLGENNLNNGIGFPTGLSINHIAAHDSANPNDTRILNENDVCKIDYGTHCNGNIIDSAFTVAFNPKFEPLLEASKDGTWTGIKLAGPDARLIELSEGIKEAIESYEIQLEGKIYPIKAVKNLGGHNIEPFKIHGDKIILGDPQGMNPNDRMKIGECYAIETFATTGDGNLKLDVNMECNHYMRKYNPDRVNFRLNTTKKLLNHINKSRKTLPFCTRWLNKDFRNYKVPLFQLVKSNIVESYPPIVDEIGMYTSQFEHTIFLHDYGKEILSFGDDY